MTFKKWIAQFKKYDEPIGDLAKDISRDADFPQTKDYEKMKTYLERKGAISEAIEIFDKAYELYKGSGY